MIFIYFLLIILFYILAISFFTIFVVQVMASFTTIAPFISIPKGIEKEIEKALNMHDRDIFYDLGCGDGRILLQIAELNKNIKIIGIEIAFLPFWIAKLRTRNCKNITIRRENIFRTNLEDATHIFMYLAVKPASKMFEEIQKQCKPGTVVVSCDFKLENIEPTKIISLEGISKNRIRGKNLFIYTI